MVIEFCLLVSKMATGRTLEYLESTQNLQSFSYLLLFYWDPTTEIQRISLIKPFQNG